MSLYRISVMNLNMRRVLAEVVVRIVLSMRIPALSIRMLGRPNELRTLDAISVLLFAKVYVVFEILHTAF